MHPSVAHEMYQQPLHHAHARMSMCGSLQTAARRNKHMQELAGWLTHLPAFMDWTPAAVPVYTESHWLPQHVGTVLPDRTLIASLHGVNAYACLPNICTGLTLMDRVGDWKPLNSQGNPILCSPKTYASTAKGTRCKPGAQYPQLGYLEGSAVPMSSGKPFQLVDYLASSIHNNSTASGSFY